MNKTQSVRSENHEVQLMEQGSVDSHERGELRRPVGEAANSVGTTDEKYRAYCEVGAVRRVWAIESDLDSRAGSTAFSFLSWSKLFNCRMQGSRCCCGASGRWRLDRAHGRCHYHGIHQQLLHLQTCALGLER